LQRGLRIEPKDRFSSMDDLLAALAHDPSVSRRRWLALAAAVGLLGVGLLAGHRMLGRGQTVCRGAESKWMGAWDHSRKEAMRVAFVASGKPYAEDAYRGVERVLDGYAKAWASMYTEACEATRVRGEQSEELLDLRMQCLSLRREETKALADLLMRADAAAVEQAVAAAEALPGLDRCANAVLLRAPLPPPVNAHTHDQVVALRKRLAAAQALKQAGKYTEGLAIASAAAREAKALAYRPLEAEALYQQGDLQERTGDAEAAQATLLSAAVAAEAGRHDALAADSFILLDWTNRQAAHYAEAHGWEQMAFAAIERLGGNDELLGRLLNSVGLTLYEEGKYPESLAAFERALALSERSTTDVASTRVGALLNNLGNVQRALGNDELAEAYHRRDLALTEKALGPMHPDVATALNNLGNVLSDRGENAQAQAQHERALAIQEAALGANHPSISTTLNNLGDVFQNQGQYEKALACHRRALLLLQQAFGPKHPRGAFSLHNMGAVFLDQGRYQTALEYHRRALAIWEDTLGHEHPYVAYALTGIGQALLGLGENAVAPLERALTLRMSQSAQPAELAETRFALARALAASRGDPKRARTLAQQARATYAVAGSRSKKELDEVDTWLQKNP
jgi:tetratricopeptide (TPR) repeat protein